MAVCHPSVSTAGSDYCYYYDYYGGGHAGAAK